MDEHVPAEPVLKPANDAVAVERLIDELVATGQMNEDTLADLERIRAEWKAGTLHPDDGDYVLALHRRILDAPAVVEEIEATEAVEDLRGQLDAALARAEAAEAEVARLRLEIETLRAGQAPTVG